MTNERIRRRLKLKKNIIQTIIERKLNMFGHKCRMKDNRPLCLKLNDEWIVEKRKTSERMAR